MFNTVLQCTCQYFKLQTQYGRQCRESFSTSFPGSFLSIPGEERKPVGKQVGAVVQKSDNFTSDSDFFKSRTFLIKRKFDFKISKVNINQIDQRVVVGSLKKSLFDG
jgi:hypothetical protein